jgi:hypothetical protein
VDWAKKLAKRFHPAKAAYNNLHEAPDRLHRMLSGDAPGEV